MRYELLISLRYFLARRREKFISIISLISVLGVAVGVMALIVVIAVMSGASEYLQDKVIGSHSHLVISDDAGIEKPAEIIAKISRIPGVVAASPFIDGRVMIRSNNQVVNVSLRGIDPAGEAKVNKLSSYLVKGNFSLAGKEVIIGEELARRLGVEVGGKLVLISPLDGRMQDFQVSGIFSSGRYDYDLGLILLNLDSTRGLFDIPADLAGGIGIRIDNVYAASRLKEKILRELDFAYPVLTWMEVDRNLFASLKLEKTAMFIILALIVVVAALNIASTLIMMVMEKTKDIGTLKAIGASNAGINLIFTLEGMLIGILGTAFGAAGGFFLCYLLKNYRIIRLPPDVYYLDRLPVKMDAVDSLVIIGAALLITLAATVYPARQAARLNPAEALRYE